MGVRTSCLLICLGLFGFSEALELSNPSSIELPKKGLFIDPNYFIGARVEYQAQKVFDKSLHISTHPVKKVVSFEEEIQMGLLSVTVAHQFEVYGGLGTNRIEMATKITDHIIQEYSTGNKFRWEVGAKGQIFNYDDGALALDVKYMSTHPSTDSFTENGTLINDQLKIKYEEWQIGVAGSYSFDIFTPYLGVRYCHPTIKVRRFRSGILPDSLKGYKVHGEKKFGATIGVTMAASKGFALNLEFNAIDENAVSLTAFLAF